MVVVKKGRVPARHQRRQQTEASDSRPDQGEQKLAAATVAAAEATSTYTAPATSAHSTNHLPCWALRFPPPPSSLSIKTLATSKPPLSPPARCAAPDLCVDKVKQPAMDFPGGVGPFIEEKRRHTARNEEEITAGTAFIKEVDLSGHLNIRTNPISKPNDGPN